MGIGCDHLSQAGSHLKKLPVSFHPFPAFFGRNPVDIRNKIDVLVTGQMLIKIRIVRDVGHLPFSLQGMGPDRLSMDQDLPLFKTVDANHRFYS